MRATSRLVTSTGLSLPGNSDSTPVRPVPAICIRGPASSPWNTATGRSRSWPVWKASSRPLGSAMLQPGNTYTPVSVLFSSATRSRKNATAGQSRLSRIRLAGARHSRESGNPNPGLTQPTAQGQDTGRGFAATAGMPAPAETPCIAAGTGQTGVWIPAFAGMTNGQEANSVKMRLSLATEFGLIASE